MYFKVVYYLLLFPILTGWILVCFSLESDSGLIINSPGEHFVFYRVLSGEITARRILSSAIKEK